MWRNEAKGTSRIMVEPPIEDASRSHARSSWLVAGRREFDKAVEPGAGAESRGTPGARSKPMHWSRW